MLVMHSVTLLCNDEASITCRSLETAPIASTLRSWPVIFTKIWFFKKKKTWGGWVSRFCRAKSDFWHPRPLQNEEPARFLYKIRAPNPFFLVHFCDFQKHWPLQSGEPDMSTHLSRIATWKKENHQKYKDPFCRGKMWKNLGLLVSPENPEVYKNLLCRGNSCPTFPVFVKSI